MEIQSGAKVDMQGKIIMLKGKKKQEFKLKLIQNGDGGQKENRDSEK